MAAATKLNMIYIHGINSERGNTSCDKVVFVSNVSKCAQWMVNHLVDNSWVMALETSLDTP